MNKVQNFLYRFMAGRYGNDQFSSFLLVLAIILLVLNMFVFKNPILSSVVWVILIYNIFRCYSRNTYKRKSENDKYLQLVAPIKKRFKLVKNNFQDKEHKYFLCPNCSTQVRVPRKRGKITITCPKCQQKFDRKS